MASHFLQTLLLVSVAIIGTQCQLDFNTDDCGKDNRGCFLNPDGCSNNDCLAIATWILPQGAQQMTFTLKGKDQGWVALGLSEDQAMGADSVMECRSASGQVAAGTSYNEASKGTITDLAETGIFDISTEAKDGFITCTFKREVTNEDAKVFSANEPYYLLLGVGPMAGNAKSFHNPDFPIISSDKVTLTQELSVGGGVVKPPLVRAHGILMMSAWTIFVCTAIMLARYYKDGWPETKLCDKMPVWFSMHRILNTSVLLLTVIAFILIFVDVKGYTVASDVYSRGHPIMGIIVTALAIINPIMALLRPHPDGERRYIFNWAHWAVGTVATILALINTYFGMSLARSETFTGTWVKFVLVAFAVLYATTVVVLEVHKCMSRSAEKDNQMEMQQPGSNQSVKPNKSIGMFQYAVFVIYAVLGSLLYLVMLIALIAG